MGIWGYFFLATAIAYIAFIKYVGYRSPQQIKEMMEAVQGGAILVDVRTSGEFNAGHISGAINIPLSDLSQRHSEIGSHKNPVVIYCRSGSRSRSALGLMKNIGFQNVLDLGPMGNWRR